MFDTFLIINIGIMLISGTLYILCTIQENIEAKSKERQQQRDINRFKFEAKEYIEEQLFKAQLRKEKCYDKRTETRI